MLIVHIIIIFCMMYVCRIFKFFNKHGENRRVSGSMCTRIGDVNVRRCSRRGPMSHEQYAMLSSGFDKWYRIVFRKRHRLRRADLSRIHDDQEHYDFYDDTRDYHDARHIDFLHFSKNYAGIFNRFDV